MGKREKDKEMSKEQMTDIVKDAVTKRNERNGENSNPISELGKVMKEANESGILVGVSVVNLTKGTKIFDTPETEKIFKGLELAGEIIECNKTDLTNLKTTYNMLVEEMNLLIAENSNLKINNELLKAENSNLESRLNSEVYAAEEKGKQSSLLKVEEAKRELNKLKRDLQEKNETIEALAVANEKEKSSNSTKSETEIFHNVENKKEIKKRKKQEKKDKKEEVDSNKTSVITRTIATTAATSVATTAATTPATSAATPKAEAAKVSAPKAKENKIRLLLGTEYVKSDKETTTEVMKLAPSMGVKGKIKAKSESFIIKGGNKTVNSIVFYCENEEDIKLLHDNKASILKALEIEQTKKVNKSTEFKHTLVMHVKSSVLENKSETDVKKEFHENIMEELEGYNILDMISIHISYGNKGYATVYVTLMGNVTNNIDSRTTASGLQIRNWMVYKLRQTFLYDKLHEMYVHVKDSQPTKVESDKRNCATIVTPTPYEIEEEEEEENPSTIAASTTPIGGGGGSKE